MLGSALICRSCHHAEYGDTKVSEDNVKKLLNKHDDTGTELHRIMPMKTSSCSAKTELSILKKSNLYKMAVS